MTDDARERLKDEAVRDAIRRIVSGEQPLTEAQLKAMSRWPAEWRAEEEAITAKRLGRGPDQVRGALKEIIRRIKQFEDRLDVIEGRVEELLGQVTLRQAGGRVALAKVGEEAMLKKLASVEAKHILAAADRLISEAIRETPEGTPECRALKKMRDEARKGKLP